MLHPYTMMLKKILIIVNSLNAKKVNFELTH